LRALAARPLFEIDSRQKGLAIVIYDRLPLSLHNRVVRSDKKRGVAAKN
jgi:hypothetical protein